LRDIYRLFVFDLESPAAGRQAMAGFESRVSELAERGGAAMDSALGEFFEAGNSSN
jgi:hypothetical protein